MLLILFFRYVTAEENVTNSEKSMQTVKDQIDDKQRKIIENQKEAKNIDGVVNEMSKKLDVVNLIIYRIF